MKRIYQIAILISLLAPPIGSVGCTSGPTANATLTSDHATRIPPPTDTRSSRPSPTVGVTPLTPLFPTASLTVSPTPWLAAFFRVTQEPVVGFWWSEEGTHLNYQTEDHLLWRYDPDTDGTKEVSSEAPVYGQPLPSVLDRVPEDVPAQDTYFAPSGSRALFVVAEYYYEGGAPDPNLDAEWMPSAVVSQVWYLSEEEPEAYRLGTIDGTVYGATWSQDETRVLMQVIGGGLYPPADSAGWLILPEKGQARNLFPIMRDDATSYILPEIMPDGTRVLFTKCAPGDDHDECQLYFRILKLEEDIYYDEPLSLPVTGGIWPLPDTNGLLIADGIVLYLYGLENGTLLQLNDESQPYTLEALTMDPPGEGTGVVKFSSDTRYIAWNGHSGLQVFSLCPGGGRLLNCE